MTTATTDTPTPSAEPSTAAQGDERTLSRRVFHDVLEMLPNEDQPSPLVRINRLAPVEGFDLFAKLEWQNPFGSVKDRAASYLIQGLERDGKLGKDGAAGIVEPTSGNTGLSLAAIAGVKGHGMRAVVPNKVPLEKKVLLKLAGAELDVINDNLCPSPGMGEGSISIAKTHAKAQPDKYTMPNQYENDWNVRAHYETTGPEIWRQTEGRITHFFASLGTCGTIAGTSRYLKERNPDVKVYAIQPTAGHDVPGLRTRDELAAQALFEQALIDEIIEIDFNLAYERAYELGTREGLFAGPSSGIIFEGARTVLQRDPDAIKGGVGVAIFCDNIFKYVSSMIKHMPHLTENTEA